MKKLVFLLVALVGICAVPAAGQADLLSLYTFDNTADNAVIGAPNGTPVGSPGYVTGQIGQAVSLDGSTQFIDATTDGFPKFSAFDGPSNGLWTGSASFWINTTTTAGGTVIGGVNNGGNSFVNLYMNDGGPGIFSIAFRVEGGSISLGLVNSPTIDWRDGAWHNISMAWSLTTGASNTGDYHFYVDGAEQAVSTPLQSITSSGVFAPWENPVRIGLAARAAPTGDFLNASLDDVGVWSNQLTPGEAGALANLGRDSVLNYGTKDAQALFGIFAGGPGSSGQTSDGKTWSYISGGLFGAPGAVVNNHTAVILDGSGNGLSTVAIVPGDLNADGLVNLTDYGILTGQWFQTGVGLAGDLNRDGTVNLRDFSIFKVDYHNFNGGGGSDLVTPVPEPGTIVLMAAAIPLLSMLRRRARPR